MIKVWTQNVPIWSSSIAIQKNSPYRPFLKEVVYQIIENGQLEQIKKKWLRRKAYCPLVDNSSYRNSLRAQSFTSFMTDFCYDINKRYLGIHLARSYSVDTLLH